MSRHLDYLIAPGQFGYYVDEAARPDVRLRLAPPPEPVPNPLC